LVNHEVRVLGLFSGTSQAELNMAVGW